MAYSAYTPALPRVVFGAGCVSALPKEAALTLQTRSVVICTPGRARAVGDLIGINAMDRAVICPAAKPNFPQSAFDEVTATIERHAADGIVSIGGGTAIGLAKAIAVNSGLPFIAVPTTYSGSELAANWYVGTGSERRQGNNISALPRTILYDPALTADLPAATSAMSGMNALAHAVETLYSPSINPVAKTMAEEAIRLLASALPLIADTPSDIEVRTMALRGAWFAAGFRAASGLEHILAQRTRDRFGLDHAATHAVVLPHAVAFNTAAAPEAMVAISRALGGGDPATGLFQLIARLGLVTGLRDLGASWKELDAIADTVERAQISHPRRVSAREARQILEAAWYGNTPDTWPPVDGLPDHQ